ncbi:MAG: tyrosine-type recombinase/integrase [Sphingomonadaceae bacterium]|nr:tyrosine-type recombinase/integrase [Sphingomonadaceae bacterium]
MATAPRDDRYLWERPGAFWFRMSVPKEHRQKAGKAIIQQSLGTRDHREARLRADVLRGDLFEEWTGKRPGTTVTAPREPSDIDLYQDAATAAYEAVLGELDTRRRSREFADTAAYIAFVEGRRAQLLDLVRRRDTGAMAHWERIAASRIDRNNWVLDKGSERHAKFVGMIAEAAIEAVRIAIERDSGNLAVQPTSKVVVAGLDAKAAKAKHGETIQELFELWAADRLAKGAKRKDTVDQDRKVITQFAEFVGKDRAIRSITAIEVANYREVLRQLPPKWQFNKSLSGLSMRAAAAKARELDLPFTAFTSINKHLSTISPLYKWLAQQPRWAGLVNPCNGLFHDKVKGTNPRPPFKTAQLNTIIQSPLFTGFLDHGREHEPGNHHADDWRRWLPLVCLFTGARIGEIAQLRIGDVRLHRDKDRQCDAHAEDGVCSACGVWFIHIAHDEEAGLTTKSGKSRPAAVHRVLEQIGFLAFHERQERRANGDPSASLFPELKANSRGQIGATPSRWWRDYLSAIRIKDGRDGFGAHSFRHTLADRLRTEAELLDDQIEVCLGHNQRSTTAGYGELTQGTVTMFKRWMDAVTFKGVDFSHLFA